MDNEFNELKITDIEISENNVKSAPDNLTAQGDTTTKDVKNIFDRLPELIVTRFNSLLDYIAGNLEELATAILVQKAEKLGGGDMVKDIYDTDGDGVVDNAAMLGGQLPSYYATAEAAQTAQTTADNAQSTADTAVTNAAAAQTTADTAVSNAQTAQNTANSALTTANAAMPKASFSLSGTTLTITY